MTIFISTFFFFFFFTDTATTEIYTLSLHDALPIFFRCVVKQVHQTFTPGFSQHRIFCKLAFREIATREVIDRSFRDLEDRKSTRLNSSHSQISYAVFCLKKKKKKKKIYIS